MVTGSERRWAGPMPEAYDRWLAPITFRPFAADLAPRVAALSPGRVLELAAGTGVLTRELVEGGRCGEVVATDLNTAMVEVGRRRVPQAEWRPADAMSLPYGAGRFDVVACQFGVMFFPDRPGAYAEARRVLTPAGTFVFNAWADLASHTFEVVVHAALARMFPDDPPGFLASVPHGYADPATIERDLRRGGFADVRIDLVTLPAHASSAADVATGYCTGTPLRTAIETRGDLAATTAGVTRELERVFGTGPVTGSMTAHVVEARPAPTVPYDGAPADR